MPSHSVSRAVRRVLAGRIATVVALSAVVITAQAENQNLDRTITVDIAPQKLSTALLKLSKQSGLQLLMPGKIVDARSSDGLKGTMSVRDALTKLLEGTSLRYRTFGDNVIGIELAEDEPGGASASGTSMRTDGLEEVVVRGVEFRYEEVLSANKMPASVKDTPQSVKVVTRDLIDFAGVQSFGDIYKVDASSAAVHTGDHYPRQYYRGFTGNSGNGVKVDGFRTTSELSLDLAVFERFELVKGATSTLYGQNSIGGTMNAISKMPQNTFGGSVSLLAGSHDKYRGDVDVYGPLTSTGDLKYRLVGAYQQADSYIDFAHDDRVIINPTIQYSPVEGTTITARVNYQRFDFSPYFGIGAQFLGTSLSDPAQLVANNFRIPDVPRSRTGNAPSNDALKEATIGQIMLDQDIGSWKLRGSAQLARIDASNNGVLMFGTDRNGLTDTLAYSRDLDSDTYSGEVNLFGDVEAFGRKHTLFFGVDFAKEQWNLFSQSASYVAGTASGFSIFNPDYSVLDIPTAPADFPTTVRMKRNHRMEGITVQAMLHPAERITVALGTRYSHDVNASRIGCCAYTAALGAESELREDAFTYQAGLTFAVTRSMNLYTSYGTTFEPQSGTLPSGAAVDPEIGKAVEVGLKADIPEHRFSYSAALFKMERTNIAQGIAGTPYVSLVGIQSSKGVELDFRGEVVRGWEVFGSLAAMDAEYTQGQFKGVQPSNAPKFGVSLFSSYEFQNGPWRGLGFGGGVVHKAGRRTTDINSYGANTPILFLGDFTEVELRGFYTLNAWRFDLTASNLLDEEYYSNTFERLNLGYQANPPRQITGSVRYRF